MGGVSEELQHICKVLSIDPAVLLPKSLQEFMEEEHDGLTAKVKYDHYEKRRKLKMKFIHDFMQSLKKKNRQGTSGAHGGAALVSLSLLPKENVVEFKRSRCKHFC